MHTHISLPRRLSLFVVQTLASLRVGPAIKLIGLVGQLLQILKARHASDTAAADSAAVSSAAQTARTAEPLEDQRGEAVAEVFNVVRLALRRLPREPRVTVCPSVEETERRLARAASLSGQAGIRLSFPLFCSVLGLDCFKRDMLVGVSVGRTLEPFVGPRAYARGKNILGRN